MIAVVPYEVRTLISWNPWTNIGIIALTLATSIAAWFGGIPDEILDSLILYDWTPTGLIGSLFLHAGIMHLLGNMMFLWVFGNAINGVMNHFLFLGIYFVLGATGGAAHLLIDGSPAVGASGAISGLLGVYFAIYPVNRIHCVWIFLVRGGTFDLPGYALLGLWFAIELFGAIRGSAEIAYWAHIGGFVAGVAIGLPLAKMGLISLGDYDNPTLLDYVERRSS